MFYSTHRFAWDFIEFPWAAVRNQFHIHWFSHPALQALGYINGSLEKWLRETNGATSDRYDISVVLWSRRSHMGFLCHVCLLVFISNLCDFWYIWVPSSRRWFPTRASHHLLPLENGSRRWGYVHSNHGRTYGCCVERHLVSKSTRCNATLVAQGPVRDK